MLQRKKYPKVSVIIPVFNDLKDLKKVLPAIENQHFPSENVEVIVVDNGSEEDINAFLITYNGLDVKYLEETTYLGSPYSCRNRGIEQANGEIIVLLDATCVPFEDWLVNGIEALISSQADIIAGNVKFDVSNNPTISEIYDATMNVRMDIAVKTRNCAFTANLFIRKKLFDSVGFFPEGIRSGGDVRWTKKATNSGAKLCYAEDATILKKTRDKSQLLKKKWRTAKYQTSKWIDLGSKYLFIRHIRAFVKLVIIPPTPYRVNYESRVDSSLYNEIPFLRIRVWMLDYRLRIVEGFGIITGGIKYLLTK